MVLLGGCHGTASFQGQHAENEKTPAPVGGPSDLSCVTDGLDYAAHIRPVLERSCFGCHAGETPSGRVSLDGMITEAEARQWTEWDGLLGRVQRGEMPPAGSGQPLTACEQEQLSRWVLDGCNGGGDPGRTALQRLNKEQLHHSLIELLHLPPTATPVADLPEDPTSRDGFNNNADLMVMNPEVFRALLLATEGAVAQALSRSDAPVLSCAGAVRRAATAPTTTWDTTAGSAPGRETLSASGWLVFWVEPAELAQAGAELWIHASGESSDGIAPILQLNVNDVPVAAEVVIASPTTKAYRIAHPFPAGVRTKVGVYFKNPSSSGDRRLKIQAIEIRPAESLCTEELLQRFAERAFRRSVSEAEVARLVGVVSGAQQRGSDWLSAVSFGLQAALVSPEFLYRVISNEGAGAVRTLDGHELATRLSFLLWNSAPDAELQGLAASGALLEEQTLAAQVRRMLADERAARFSESFAGQWLSSRRTLTALVAPDPTLLPDLDDAFRAALKGETDALFHDVLTSDAPITRLLDADYTFANDQLAKLYGLSGVSGAALQKVSLAGAHRRGVLTHASVLMGNSAAERSSPIKRGFWILDRITCTPPASPPVNIDTSAFEQGHEGTVRERLAVHRQDASCNGCHASMDPVGLAFEHFDAVGRYRTTDLGAPVDATGVLPDGRAFADHDELVDLLKVDPQFTRCVTQKLYSWALGRSPDAADTCNIRKIADRHLQTGGSLADLVTSVVLSDAFRQTRTEP